MTVRQGDKETRRQGDKETRRQGDKETRRQGDKETRRQGDKETRRQGDKETRRQGDIACGLLVSPSPCLLVWLSGDQPMPSVKDILASLRAEPGKKFRLDDHDPAWAGDKDLPKKERKRVAEAALTEDLSALARAQDLLYAADTYAILLVFQAM